MKKIGLIFFPLYIFCHLLEPYMEIFKKNKGLKKN